VRFGCTVQQIFLITFLHISYQSLSLVFLTVSDFTGVSTSSGCRIIKRVSEAIASLRPNYINMYENVEEMNRSAEKMYQIARFPRVIGAIDCTLIKI
jgi:hypothetical protein